MFSEYGLKGKQKLVIVIWKATAGRWTICPFQAGKTMFGLRTSESDLVFWRRKKIRSQLYSVQSIH